MAQRVGVLCTRTIEVSGVSLSKRLHTATKGLGEAYIFNYKIDECSFVPISKCRSAFAWWDYSKQDFALPICAN